MITFGKYRGRPSEDLINDKPYFEWFMKQDFIKRKYKKDYDMIKNYKEPFFNILEKHLDWDCILMVSNYLNLNNDHLTKRAFTGYAPADGNQSKVIGGYDEHHKYWNGFKHRINIYNVLKTKYERHTKLNEVNFKEWSLFHKYNNEAQLISSVLKKKKIKSGFHRDIICPNAEVIYDNQCKIEKPHFDELMKFCSQKIIPFGKYKNNEITWIKWHQAQNYHQHYNSGNQWVMDFDSVRWKLDKYMQWVNAEKVVDQYPLFKFYLEQLKYQASIIRMSKRFYD